MWDADDTNISITPCATGSLESPFPKGDVLSRQTQEGLIQRRGYHRRVAPTKPGISVDGGDGLLDYVGTARGILKALFGRLAERKHVYKVEQQRRKLLAGRYDKTFAYGMTLPNSSISIRPWRCFTFRPKTDNGSRSL